MAIILHFVRESTRCLHWKNIYEKFAMFSSSHNFRKLRSHTSFEYTIQVHLRQRLPVSMPVSHVQIRHTQDNWTQIFQMKSFLITLTNYLFDWEWDNNSFARDFCEMKWCRRLKVACIFESPSIICGNAVNQTQLQTTRRICWWKCS